MNNDMTDEEIEKEIQPKGLAAPRVTLAHVDSVIAGETFTMLPSGRTMICELTLANGFTMRGESSVVSHENFNEELGRKISRTRARAQIWQLEAYLLKEKLKCQMPPA